MIYNFYSTSLIFLAGFCLFSAVSHFTYQQFMHQRRVHQLFAGITLSLIGTILTNVINSNTLNIADHIIWERVNIAFSIVMIALLPWFFAFYSGVRARSLLAGSTALCILLFFINLARPNTLLHSEIQGIDRLQLPWGEEVFLTKATPSIWGIISFAYLIFVCVFSFYVVVSYFRLKRKRSTLYMMFGVAFLIAGIIQTALVRIMGINNLPPLIAFGFLIMIIIMGRVLTRELWEDRKLAQEALQQSERKTRAILDQSIQFIGLLSPDGTLLDANRAALELVGVTPQDVFNKPFWVSPWWNHSTELQNKLRESIKSAAAGEEVRFEASHPTTDGSLRYIDFSLRPVKNEQGDILYLIPEGHDITERKLAEENFMQSQRKLATLMANLPGLAFQCMNDQDWTMTFMSEGCFELTGFYPQELEGNLSNSYGKLIHKDDKEMVWQKVQSSIKSYTLWQIEYRINTKDGKEKWVWEQGCGVYSNVGDLEALEGFISDITERKHAEKALQETHQLLKSTFASLHDGVFVIDFRTKAIIDCNIAATEIFGYSREEMLGKSTEFLHINKDALGEFRNHLSEGIAEKGYLFLPEFNMKRKDGTIFPTEHTVTQHLDEQGVQIGWVSVVCDITDRKLAVQALKESEERYKLLINNIMYPVIVSSFDGKMLYINQKTADFLEIEPSEIRNLKSPNFWVDPTKRDEYIAELKTNSVVRNKEVRFCNKKNEMITVVMSSNIIDYYGQKAIFSIYNDITERKRAEEKLRESQVLYHDLVETSQDLIWQCDAQGRYIYLNLAFEKLFGYQLDEMLGRPFTDFQSPQQAKLDLEIFGRLLQANGIVNGYESVHLKKDGTELHLVFNAKVVFDAEGHMSGTRGTAYDITQRKQAEVELQQSEARLSALLSSMKDIIFEIDLNGCFEGHYAQDIKGLYMPPDFFIRKKIEEVLPPNVSILLKGAIENIYDGIQFEQFEYSLTIDNNIQFESAIVTPRYNISNEIIGITVVCRDITERKLAEQELLESKEKYRYLVDNSPIGIFQRSIQGSFNFCNLTLAKQFECITIDEFLLNYNDLSKRWPNREQFIEFNEVLLKNGEVLGFENEVKLINGKTKWFELYYKLDSTKSILDGFSLDITERKLAERALNMLATSFAGLSGKAFFEASSKHIATEMGIDYVYVGELTDTKDSVRVLGGFALGEAMGEMLYSLADTPCSDVIENDSCIYPKGIQQLYPKDILLQQMGIDSYLGARIYNKEQEPIGLLVALHSKPLNNPDTLSNLFSIFLDRIAAELHRMLAYETLHKNEAIQRKMVSNIGDVIVIIDKNGINRYKSLNIEKWFGWKPEEVVGKSTWDNVHPDDFLMGQEFLGSIMSEPNASGTIELRYRKKDDSYCWIEITIVNLLHDPDICGLLGNYHDISERKKAEDALRKSESLFRKMNENSPLGMHFYMINDKNQLIFEDANPSASRLLKVDNSIFIGKTIENAFPPLIQTEVPARYRNAAEKGIPWITEQIAYNDNQISGAFEVTAFQTAPGKMVAIFTDITDRKKAEQAIKESNDYNRQLFSSSQIGLVLAKMTGELVDLNQAYADIIGYTIEETLQLSYWDITPEKYAEKEQEQLKSLYEKGFYGPYEKEYIHKNGALVPVLLSGTIIEREDEKYIWSSIEDITERKKNEANLLKLHTAINYSKVSIVITDIEGNIEFANPYFSVLTGYSEEEYLGQNPKVLKSGVHSDEYYKIIWDTIKSGHTWEGEFCNRKKNGELYWEMSIITPIKNEKEEIVNFVAIKSDITDKKGMEVALRESEELFRNVTTLSGYLVFDYNPDNGFITWNGAIEQLTGYTKLQFKDINYKKWIKLVHPDDKELASSGFEDIKTTNTTFNYEYRLKIKSEDYTWFEALGFKQWANNLNGFKIIGIMRDITQYKTVEEKILNGVINAEERERLHFSQELHDGLGPLISAIRLYVDLILDPESKMDKKIIVRKVLELLAEASTSLREISFRLSPHTLQNFGIVPALKSFINRIMDINKIDIIFNCGKMERLKEITETIIYRIICECINNTIKHANANKIVIEMAIKNENLAILYTDDGIGFISEELLNSPKGIGLLNMQSRIKSINGHINIQSKPGSGFRMQVKIKL